MKKVMFILHMYSVGGAERRCISVANYLAAHGIQVKVVMLDMYKMYSCRRNYNGLEVDIDFADAPKVQIPASKDVELVYLQHPEENVTPENNITYIPYSENGLSTLNTDFFIKPADTLQKNSAKKQLEQLESLYVNRIYQYVKNFPDYTVISWMTFVNIATAVALQTLPNEFAFVECTSPDIEFSKDSGFNLLKEIFYPRAKAGFFQTQEMRDFYTYLPDIKAFVIPNPILAKLPHSCIEERTKNIVNFCRVEKAKNLELLIDSFSVLHSKFPEYRLNIYGDGSEKEHLKSIVEQKNLQDYIMFFDFTPDVHSKIINDAMFVSTSNREGISNSMIEAMALGVPTICTDCHGGGARAIISDGINGLLVPMEDKESLVIAMSKIIESPHLAQKLSENGKQIRKTLSISNIGDMWLQAIQAL